MPVSKDIKRPDPEALLRAIKREDEKERRGKLKVFFGMCAGVGKTYKMLQAAQEAKKKGTDIIVGYVETHGRRETEALLQGLPIIPRRKINYRETVLEEMDLDAILARKPALALVDELAHTNAPGSRHNKRHLDVIELLDNGIDVYTTLNVQHLESRADTVAQITGAVVRETIPDSIFEQAAEVEVVDLPPDELLKRLAEGKVYTPERSQRAIENFFREGNLTALREMCLRLAAERVEHQLRDYMRVQRIPGPWKSGERLIMGIGPSPASVRLIRWAHRIAFTIQASWIAVYVEKSTPLGEAEKNQLAKNIALARELGAEVITTAEDDVAAALLRVAREQNATQLIVGKSEKGTRFQKSVLDRLIEQSGEIDIYVVGGDEQQPRKRKSLRVPYLHSGVSQYLFSAAIVVVVAALCFPFANFIGYQTVSLILLLAVALLPLRLGIGPVVLAAALSALMWDFLFIPPQFTFAIRAAHDVLMLGAYFAIAAVTGVLTARVRARERGVRLREQRATALYMLTNDLSSAHSQDDVVQAAVTHIKKFFDADVVVFLSELDGDFLNKRHPTSSYAPDDKELGVSAWVHWNEKRAGKFTDTLPFAQATYFPLSGPRYPLGVIGVKLNQRLTLDQEILLENFIRQISSALDREFLNEMAKQSAALAESERLYTTLFNSVSHEMRTPITAILSASESLMDHAVVERPEIRQRLASEIQSAAERLDKIVQNLLDMTRLESGLIQPKLDWCDVPDVINAALNKLSKELSDYVVTVEMAPTLPLIKLDFNLIEQALVNLLRNSATHTPAGTTVKVKAYTEDQGCVIIVEDNGPGFPVESLGKIFEKFYRVPGSKTSGIGLGLSIALGFIEAHDGTLTVEDCPTGGARFTIRLPVLQSVNPSEDLSHG